MLFKVDLYILEQVLLNLRHLYMNSIIFTQKLKNVDSRFTFRSNSHKLPNGDVKLWLGNIQILYFG